MGGASNAVSNAELKCYGKKSGASEFNTCNGRHHIRLYICRYKTPGYYSLVGMVGKNMFDMKYLTEHILLGQYFLYQLTDNMTFL